MAIRRRSVQTSERGLPSLNQARYERRRAIVAGKVRVRAMPPHFWLWLLIGLTVFAVVYWWLAARELAGQKAGLMAKQRTIAQSIGPRILPFRAKVESWVVEFGAERWPGDFVETDVDLEAVRTSSGVYLRLLQSSARDSRTIASAATRSLHDGFTSCFFIRKGEADARNGASCTNLGDCASGLLCNEWNVCARPPRPYNLRLAYRAMRVLSQQWLEELHEATSDLAVRVLERDLAGVTKNDIPVAIDLLSDARYFTLVLDEDSNTELPVPLNGAGRETDEQRLQRVSHPARVGVWELSSGKLLARVRRQAGGEFVAVGQSRSRSPANVAAQQRQTNSCALALAARHAMTGATSTGNSGNSNEKSAGDAVSESVK